MTTLCTVLLCSFCSVLIYASVSVENQRIDARGIRNHLREERSMSYFPLEGHVPLRKISSMELRDTRRHRRSDGKNDDKSSDGEQNKNNNNSNFPFWTLLLVPLIVVLIIAIVCFALTKRSYNKAVKKMEELQKREQELSKREGAGAATSARDNEAPGSGYAGFGSDTNGKRPREGGMGSIMRDPDMDPSVIPEKAQVSRMIYSRQRWRTVDRVPSDMSFEIPSETAPV
ncbi:hypothetical protein Q1695_004840 [Nippostrongylus brasiliensis]|nr:hypothetical protein Q1695_004840 [Nippostrongylus brasiliensis]